MSVKNLLENYKSKFKSMLDRIAIDVKAIYTPLSWLGFTLIPELLINGKVSTMSSVAGSAVLTFSFLTAAQVFGMKGVLAHAFVYGIGSVVGGFVVLLK